MKENNKYLLVERDRKKLYLNPRPKKLSAFFDCHVLKTNLLVTYLENDDYGECYYSRDKSEPKIIEEIQGLKISQLESFFSRRKLNCREFHFILSNGCEIKTFYGNDLIIYNENVLSETLLSEILILCDIKTTNYFSAHDVLIKLEKDIVEKEFHLAADFEEFLLTNEHIFFNEK